MDSRRRHAVQRHFAADAGRRVQRLPAVRIPLSITPFGTMTRYPNELTVEEHHAKQAIAFAEQILNWTASALR